jgi:hypothetical protein
MFRLLAALTVFAILGSPVLACAAMFARQAATAKHACCHKKPQPEPKCCLLNPPLTSEPAASVTVVKAAPVALPSSLFAFIARVTHPAAEIKARVDRSRDILLQTRSLRL